MDRLAGIVMNHVPLRKNSKLLACEQTRVRLCQEKQFYDANRMLPDVQRQPDMLPLPDVHAPPVDTAIHSSLQLRSRALLASLKPRTRESPRPCPMALDDNQRMIPLTDRAAAEVHSQSSSHESQPTDNAGYPSASAPPIATAKTEAPACESANQQVNMEAPKLTVKAETPNAAVKMEALAREADMQLAVACRLRLEARTEPQLTEFEQRMQAALDKEKEIKKEKDAAIKKEGKEIKTVRQSQKGPSPRKAIMSKPAAASGPCVVHRRPPKKAILPKPAGKPSKHPELPTTHGSVIYRSGKVFVHFGQCSFRVMKDCVASRSDGGKAMWQGKTPSLAEWRNVLGKIDSYCDDK